MSILFLGVFYTLLVFAEEKLGKIEIPEFKLPKFLCKLRKQEAPVRTNHVRRYHAHRFT